MVLQKYISDEILICENANFIFWIAKYFCKIEITREERESREVLSVTEYIIYNYLTLISGNCYIRSILL